MNKEHKRISMKWFAVLLCFTLVFAIGFTFLLFHSGYADKVLARYGLKSKAVTTNYTAKAWDKCLRYLGIDSDVVFFGDSITSGFNFSRYYPDITICNFGIAGDSIQGMDERVYMIETVKPEKIFVLGGINSLRDKNFDMTFGEYEQLVDSICEKNKTEIYIFSILPISKEKEKIIGVSNKTITRFNHKISELAKDKGIEYIDIASLFLLDGVMNPAYTTDGVHLTQQGYDVWANAISDYLK